VATRRTVEPTTFEVALVWRDRSPVPARLSIRWTKAGVRNYVVEKGYAWRLTDAGLALFNSQV
jgi:hypothetical protein